MTKTIKIIRLAPGESVLITTTPDLKPSHEAAAICLSPCQNRECPYNPCGQPPEEVAALFRIA